jgi:two-component SAPR family response regulator
MRVLVIEDEHLAAKRLIDLIKKYDSSIEVVKRIDSVKKSVEWLQNNPAVDLVFMDIQLADGLSFEIFEQCEVKFTSYFHDCI